MLVLLVSSLIVLSDQWTKSLVRARYDLGELHPIAEGWFNLTYLRNTGAAWGLFGGQNGGLLILSVVVLVALIAFRRSFLAPTWEHRLALALMIGGILGNLLDRLRYGWVTDFLDFYWKEWHWPAFNIADAAICTGVGLYILSSFWLDRHLLREAARPDAAAGA
jgi:signal peptidase II